MLYRCIAPDMGMSDVWKEMYAYEYIVKCMCTFGFHHSQSKLSMCVLPIPLKTFGGHGPYVLVHVGFIRFCVRSWLVRQQIFRQKRMI